MIVILSFSDLFLAIAFEQHSNERPLSPAVAMLSLSLLFYPNAAAAADADWWGATHLA